MGPVSIARWIILTLILLLAIVVLGVSGHLIAIRTTHYWKFAALAIAVSSITLLTFPIILLVSVVRGHKVLLIAEAIWLTIMWILWLATGADTTHASRRHYASGACSYFSRYSGKTCNEFRLVEALSYIIFIMLFFYSIVLFVYAITGSHEGSDQRGHGVETGQVRSGATAQA